MDERAITTILGAMMYAIGAILVNLFIEPAHRLFVTHPAVELLAVSLGVFFLSSFFWGRFSYFLLLVAGLWLGGLFPQHPIYVTLAWVPLLFALAGGTEMGENAEVDMRGKGNFFDAKGNYIAMAAVACIFAITIGILTPDIQAGEAVTAAMGVLKAIGVV